ncbi:hypothetical protein [Xanthomonas sp. MWU16-30325]|uniref:hypothetical protein n=1 Tax=Xanthomonas sp. MWU16-30325 TaxID=2878096 RepID=UPI001CF8F4DD|nr:hypothetical protein [Xanthomonas sp. MWU16-30325]
MATEICPLAADWGNWADWAAVFVGSVAALGTIWVATLANGTSKRATEIAEEAKKIAEQQHQESLRLRGETARIIGRLLFAEIGTVPNRAATVARALRKSVKDGDSISRISSVKHFDKVIFEAGQDLLPTAELVLDRIHTLPDALGADLATIIAASKAFKAMAARLDAKAERMRLGTDAETYVMISIHDAVGDFLGLQQQAHWLIRFGAGFANDFQNFVGVPVTDYSALIKEFAG